MALDPATIGGELVAHRHRITAVAALVIREPDLAEDVFQQVVVAALEDGSRFADRQHLLRWALTAARHRAVDYARARRRVVLHAAVYELIEAEAAEAPAADIEARLAALRQCVDGLPSDARRLLRLRYDDGLSCGDVAGRVGRSVGAVHQALCRLHRALRRCVEKRVAATDG
jgi:RNA polymerase sigma-70 factor (ECF subfamily)